MKNSFPSFYRLTEEQYKRLWSEAIIVFDTNVLLNIYRYQEETRKEVLDVITSLKERLWIPHHVGLEFQRNRLDVIVEQHSKFEEVRSIIKSSIGELNTKLNSLQLPKRHSLIKPDKIIDDIKIAEKGYLQSLDTLEKESLETLSDDKIRTVIDNLFEQRVGQPPKSQLELDKTFQTAEARFKRGIPPGFKDAAKEEESFAHEGLIYKKCFGDFVIWEQLIEHINSAKIKSVIFVTDDSKADWWKIIKGRNMGMHPELICEMQSAGASLFHGYNMLSFLKFAKEHLNATVTPKAMGDVEGTQNLIKKRRLLRMADKFDSREKEEIAIFNWLKEAFRHLIEVEGSGDIDFVGVRDNKKYGVSVKVIRGPADLESIEQSLSRSRASIIRNELDYVYDLIAFRHAPTSVMKKFIALMNEQHPMRGDEIIVGELDPISSRYENPDQPLDRELRFRAIYLPPSFFSDL